MHGADRIRKEIIEMVYSTGKYNGHGRRMTIAMSSVPASAGPMKLIAAV